MSVDLSIIICTRNRVNLLIAALESVVLSLNVASPISAEIIIVDNASTDNTFDLLTRWANSCPYPISILYEIRRGLAAARNCALKSAKGNLLAWTDDDCRMSPTYILELLQHDREDKELVMRGGRVDLGNQDDLELTVKTDLLRQQWSKKNQSARYQPLENCILGCNMAMRREIFVQLGFFDERFGAGAIIPAGEDTDYVYRAYLAGIKLEYVPDMKIMHFHGRRTAEQGHLVFQNYMISRGALYAKYIFRDQNLCRHFYWDLKSACKELFEGRNNFFIKINFSYKKIVFCCFIGAVKFVWLTLRQQIRPLTMLKYLMYAQCKIYRKIAYPR